MKVKKCIYISLWLFLTCVLLSARKIPDISSQEAQDITHSMLQLHIKYNQLSQELMKRAISTYVNMLDPNKIYFTYEEVARWTEPTDQLAQQVLVEYEKQEFTTFKSILNTMKQATIRRQAWDEKLAQEPILTNVKPADFEDTSWAKNEQELYERLRVLKSLQLKAVQDLSEEEQNHFLNRIKKRRKSHEEIFITEDAHFQNQVLQTYFVKSIAKSLDPNTEYMTPREVQQFMTMLQQRIVGIGVSLEDHPSGFKIRELVSGGPAERQGKLKPGDLIVAVDSENIIGIDSIDAVSKIQGEKGSSVTLTVLRETDKLEEKVVEKIDVTLVRDEIVIEELRVKGSAVPFGDGVIGVFTLYSFYQTQNYSVTSDLQEAILKMKDQYRLKGIILDMRNNTGGLLTSAVDVAGLFIKPGIVVSVQQKNRPLMHLRTNHKVPIWDGPLVILMNRRSASSTEIVTQSLQDYGRAIVVGDDQSFGKGTFQIFSNDGKEPGRINPKGEYRVTLGLYFTVSGKSPQLVGVVPDIEIPGPFCQTEVGERFQRFPLNSNQIPAHFKDDLADLNLWEQLQLGINYRSNQQKIIETYRQFLPILKENVENRLKQNMGHQFLMKYVKNKNETEEEIKEPPFYLDDFQLHETIHVAQDLIYLTESKPVAVAQ